MIAGRSSYQAMLQRVEQAHLPAEEEMAANVLASIIFFMEENPGTEFSVLFENLLRGPSA